MALPLSRRSTIARTLAFLMKSLIRFTLLFALIVIGKLTKQPELVAGTVKVEPKVNPISVEPVSFFQPADSRLTTQENIHRLWHSTAPVTSSVLDSE